MEFSQSLPIGVFDSGVGGLTVLRALKRRFPNERFCYLADIARTPYGCKSESTITSYVEECCSFLLQKRVKMIVIACNTASTVQLSEQLLNQGVPFVRMVDPAAEAASEITENARVGILATTQTVRSGAYTRALELHIPGVSVCAVPCPLFVPLVEEGIFEGELVEKALERYLPEIASFEPDTVILGCTHFPMLRQALQKYFGLGVKLVECGPAAADYISARLSLLLNPSAQPVDGDEYYITDGLAGFCKVASLVLGETPHSVTHVPALPTGVVASSAAF